MIHTKAYYSLKLVKKLISTEGCHRIRETARKTAYVDFGWKAKDIKRAFLKLQPEHFYKCGAKYDNPKIHVDYYKAYGLLNENVYIHFRIEYDVLIICSFKRI
jgi:hypothetical protein